MTISVGNHQGLRRRLLATLGCWLWPLMTLAGEHESSLSAPVSTTVTTTVSTIRTAPHGVILLYHRVADNGPDSTRVSPAQFSAHLDHLLADGYSVLPLEHLLDGIYNSRPLPRKPVAITFDDAYRSVGEVAYPMLRQRKMPFTVFVASGVVDTGASSFLSWSALRDMALDPLVSFGGHSVNHPHLELLAITHSPSQEASRSDEIDTNMAQLRAKLGDSVIDAFAYPYGEFSAATEALLKERKLYGLAQQSGAVDVNVPQTRIPRFPLYQGQGDQQRLERALTTKPLPVITETPNAVVIPANAEAPSRWRFKWGEGKFNAHQIACFSSKGEALATELKDGWATVELPSFSIGRNKVNCTAPSTDEPGSYFWYARLWLMLSPEGLPD